MILLSNIFCGEMAYRRKILEYSADIHTDMFCQNKERTIEKYIHTANISGLAWILFFKKNAFLQICWVCDI